MDPLNWLRTRDWKFIVTRTPDRVLKRITLGHWIGTWEPEVWKRVKGITGGVFIDVGANIGSYSVRLHKNFRQVYAVEANPEAAEELRLNIEKRGIVNISILRFAASDQDGRTPFYVDGTPGKCNGSADTIEPVFVYRPASNLAVNMKTIGVMYPEKGRTMLMVDMHRLDNLPFLDGPVALVKIDVEGAEFRVLDGMRGLLQRGLVKNLVVELHDRERRGELVSMLEHYGFKLSWVDLDHVYGRLG